MARLSCCWLLKQACQSWYSGPQTCVTVPRCALHLLPSTQQLNQDICITAAVACVAQQPVPTVKLLLEIKSSVTWQNGDDWRGQSFSIFKMHYYCFISFTGNFTVHSMDMLVKGVCKRERETLSVKQNLWCIVCDNSNLQSSHSHTHLFLISVSQWILTHCLSLISNGKNTHTLWLQTQGRDSVLLSIWARQSVTWYLSPPSIMTGCGVLTQEVKRKETLATARG